eukprot:222438-Heterocapsa_arctica.AAC.1
MAIWGCSHTLNNYGLSADLLVLSLYDYMSIEHNIRSVLAQRPQGLSVPLHRRLRRALRAPGRRWPDQTCCLARTPKRGHV